MSNEDRENLTNWAISQIENTLTNEQLSILISYLKGHEQRASDPNQIHFHINVYTSIGNVV